MSLTSYQTAPPRVRVLFGLFIVKGRGAVSLFPDGCFLFSGFPSMEGLAATYSPTP